MNSDFRKLVDSLEPKFISLMAMSPVRYANRPDNMPESGIYLFSEGDQHLYVGRTKRMRQRLAGHCRRSSNHFSATFAFRIAREESGLLNATYTATGSRPELLKDPVFGPAFERAKAKIANMDIRFVEEKDSNCQALLEIYASISLNTRYNKFDTH